MTLVRGDLLSKWMGEPLNEIRYPSNIETIWDDTSLANIGLYRIVKFVLPVGKRIVSGPTYSIVDGKAVESFVIEDIPPPTPEEIEASKEANTPAETDLIFKVLFNHENRIRTLESKPAITATQFRAALKAMLE